jgi:hypothetical protein
LETEEKEILVYNSVLWSQEFFDYLDHGRQQVLEDLLRQ